MKCAAVNFNFCFKQLQTLKFQLMKLNILQSKTIQDLQGEFAAVYPYLKIEFFESAHKPEQGSMGSVQYPRMMKLGELSPLLNEGNIDINTSVITSQLEQVFQREFGLNAQVFRNMAGTWIQTTSSDYLSLAEQNELGRGAAQRNRPTQRIEDSEY